MKKLTQKRLKELLHYDPETGIFTWRKRILSRNRVSKNGGKVAGGINKTTGYVRIGVEGKKHKASRLAWLYVEGYFPEHDVDHRNRIRDDNKWENLRHATRSCNIRNCKTRSDNTSGITGVYWNTQRQKWFSHIAIPGKRISLGLFNSKLNAAKARLSAEIKFGFPGCNSTSSAYLYIQNAEKNGSHSAIS